MQLDYSSSHSLILVRKGEVGTVFIITLVLLLPVITVVIKSPTLHRQAPVIIVKSSTLYHQAQIIKISSGANNPPEIIKISSGASSPKSEVWQRWQLGWRPEGEDVPRKVTQCIVSTVMIVQCTVQTPMSGFCYV